MALELLGPVAREAVEEVLPRARPQEEDVRPDAARAGLARPADDLGELLGPIRDPGEDRRHPDRRAHAGFHEPLQRAEPLTWRRGAGLRLPPDLLVERRNRERDGDLGAPSRLDEHVDVADDHRAAGDDAERVRRVRQRLETRASQSVAALGRLVRIGRRADRD